MRNVKIHYFYKITNLINGKFYYGIRTCHCLPGQDPYMGSGTYLHRAYRKYGIENFKKEILRVCRTREDVSDLERWIVTEELVKDPRCYNIKIGGDCPESYYGGIRCYIGDKYVIVSPNEYWSNHDMYTSVMKDKVYVKLESGKTSLIDKNEVRNKKLDTADCYMKKGESIMYDIIEDRYVKVSSKEYRSNKDRYKTTFQMRGGFSYESKRKISSTMKDLVKKWKE